jgi:amidase
MSSIWNAFMNEQLTLSSPQAVKGSLSGWTFGVKDVFALAGHTSSAGNPDWLRTHTPADQTATAIERLLKAGAILQGTTHTDELMYSLNGQNVHYGTPINPRAEDRIPGGSSSGSAVAVAAGLRDFAIGTDTGGSVRIPSSYCGIYGMRPTHGLIPIDGVIPLAQGFDTVGWMANTADVLLEVGKVLIEHVENATEYTPFHHVYFPEEAWALAESETRAALQESMEQITHYVKEADGHTSWGEIAPEGLSAWMTAFRTIQALEIWQEHQEWVEEVQPVFGTDIADRFAWASTLRLEDNQHSFALKEQVSERLHQMLGRHGLLVLPTATGAAPYLNIQGEENERRRSQTMQLSCIAGLSGLPQITIPVANIQGAPIGLSVIAAKGQDIRLLEWVKRWAEQLK